MKVILRREEERWEGRIEGWTPWDQIRGRGNPKFAGVMNFEKIWDQCGEDKLGTG